MNRLPAFHSPPEVVRAVLTLLPDRARRAARPGAPAPEMPVSRARLLRAGLAEPDLDTLLAGGYLEEAAPPAGRGAAYCLTPAGQKLGRALTRSARAETNGRAPPGVVRPRWDRGGRALWLGGEVVKRVARGALREEALLAALEEAGWPGWLDYPLPQLGKGAARWLRDAARSLNHGLSRLEFRADGRGQRVGWRLLPGG